MPAFPTDAQIRANLAFPRTVNAIRITTQVFWFGLPVFVIVAVYAVFLAGHRERPWAFAVAGVLAVFNMAAQVFSLRRAREPLSEISADAAVRSRAWKLAVYEATPKIVRRIPGA